MPDTRPYHRPWGIGLLLTLPYSGVVVLIAGVGQGAGALINQGLPILYPFIQKDLNLSLVQVGLITSALMGGGMVTVLVGGWLTDALGVRRVLTACLTLLVLPVLGFSLTRSLWVALALAVAAGMAEAPSYPASSRAIMDWVPRRTRGMAMSLKQTGVPIAGLVAAVTLPSIAVAVNWRVSVVVLAAMILLAALIFLLLYRDKPSTGVSTGRITLGALGTLARERRLILPTLWASVLVAFQFIVLSYLVLFLVEEIGLSPVVAGAYMGMAHVASLTARIMWGAASDFLFGARRIVVLGTLGAVAAAGLLGASFTHAGTPTGLLLLIPITLGATVLAWHGVFTVLIGEIAGAALSGTAVGATNTVMRITMIVAPPLFGLLVDVTDSYALGWSIAAGLALASTVALVLFGKDPRRS